MICWKKQVMVLIHFEIKDDLEINFHLDCAYSYYQETYKESLVTGVPWSITPTRLAHLAAKRDSQCKKQAQEGVVG